MIRMQLRKTRASHGNARASKSVRSRKLSLVKFKLLIMLPRVPYLLQNGKSKCNESILNATSGIMQGQTCNA